MTGWRAGMMVLACAASACGGAGTSRDADGQATASSAAAADPLLARFDRLVDRIDFDDEQGSIRRLRPGDRALYVLFAVDGEINNGGFSQLLFNSTGELFDEAVESARLVGATKTMRLLQRLPRTLDTATIPESRGDRQRLLDALTPEQETQLGRIDEQWFSGVSVEIEERIRAYLDAHPSAFS